MTTDLTTNPAPAPGVTLPVTEVVAAATALAKVARWDTADNLLTATATTLAADPGADPKDRAALALAIADTAVDRDMFTGTRRGPAAIAAAEPLVAATGDPVASWDLEALRLYADYQTELFGGETAGEDTGRLPEFGPDGRDPGRLVELMGRADRLTVEAPDAGRRGWASFYGRLVVDNLMGDRSGGAGRFGSALRLGERVGDGLLVSYALRHLGGHDEEDGDLAAARERWEKAADLRAADGHLTGVLAQQIWLAVIAERSGGVEERAGARAVATEVRRLATALGLSWLVRQADELLVAAPGSAARSGSVER